MYFVILFFIVLVTYVIEYRKEVNVVHLFKIAVILGILYGFIYWETVKTFLVDLLNYISNKNGEVVPK